MFKCSFYVQTLFGATVVDFLFLDNVVISFQILHCDTINFQSVNVNLSVTDF